ncbi:hypothetical protein COTS27_01043 [Spirochaetota bacterium]|nr:hypothetical protein COTS27_01043 [Spirochaetota bacterium]
MLANLFETFTKPAKTLSDLVYQRRQNAFNNKLATARQKLLEQEAQARRRGRHRAQKLFSKGEATLKGLKGYELDDIYQKLNFGNGPDDLRRYRAGAPLKEHLLPASAFNKWLKNKQSATTQRENLNILRQLRDKGTTAIDTKQLGDLLRRQRSENKALQNTLTQRAIEQGQRPHRARLTERLLAAQSAANRNNQLFADLAAANSARRYQALGDLEKGLATRFNQFSQRAEAADRINARNTDIRNQTLRSNQARRQHIQDANTDLHNKTRLKNAAARTKAQKSIIDAHNDKLRSLADLAKTQAQTYHRY